MSLDDPAPDLTAVDALRLGDRLQIGAAETLDVTDLGAGRLALSAPRRTGLAGALAAFEALTAEGSETVIFLYGSSARDAGSDLLLEHRFSRIDVGIHKRGDAFTQFLNLGGVGEIHDEGTFARGR